MLHFRTVQYICDPGYKLVPEGKNSRMCQENGQWDGIAPQCEREKFVFLFGFRIIMHSLSTC